MSQPITTQDVLKGLASISANGTAAFADQPMQESDLTDSFPACKDFCAGQCRELKERTFMRSSSFIAKMSCSLQMADDSDDSQPPGGQQGSENELGAWRKRRKKRREHAPAQSHRLVL